MNRFLRVREESETTGNHTQTESSRRRTVLDLGDGSEVIYIPRFLSFESSWKYFEYLDKQIPWSRPTVHSFGRSCLQHRDICYVASAGLPDLTYSGYQPQAYSWDDFPPLKEILDEVHKALPAGSSFNSLLLNRYKDGNDYVGWHADGELYGPTPEIASVSFGCEREFLLKKKPSKKSKAKKVKGGAPSKRLKNDHPGQHSFTLKHGSLLLMRGYTQRDWLHSLPKRAKAEAVRINLTFRRVV